MVLVNEKNSCYEVAMSYPGSMLDYPYIIHNNRILRIEINDGDLGNSLVIVSETNKIRLDRFLNCINEEPLEKRIGILAYGSNRNPDNISWKLNKYRNRKGLKVSKTILVIPAIIKNADVVASNIFYSGHFFGDILFAHKYTEGTEIEAAIQLLDKNQVEAIHISEEIPSEWEMELNSQYWGCGIAVLPDVYMYKCKNDYKQVKVLAYVSSISIFVSPITNEPIAFSQVKAKGRKLISENQYGMYRHLKAIKELDGMDMDIFRGCLSQFWEGIKAGTKDFKMEQKYLKVCDIIKRNALRHSNFEIRTGISEARKMNLLLNPKDTWKIPEQYYYPNFMS